VENVQQDILDHLKYLTKISCPDEAREEVLQKISMLEKDFEGNISQLKEVLDFFRIVFGYQVFDLEATRRENNYLRKMLEGTRDD